MLLQTQLNCGVMARFLIFLCLVRFAAAKCVPENCGDFEVSYPFWINNPDCGLSYPNFQITCRKNKHTGILAPFLKGFVGNDNKFLHRHYYRITEIDYKGHLIMDSSSIKAVSCDPRSIAKQYFGLSTDSPFTLSNSNRLVVLGCGTFGTYSYVETGWDWVLDENLGDARCVSVCKPRTDQPYCPNGCCELILPDNWPWINFTAGVSPHHNNKKCAVSIIMDPSTFRGEGRKASYGLRLNWGIGLQNCSAAKATADYSCSIHAECNDSPSGYGHICKCLPGYEGNGYFNGTDCTDINECRNKWTSWCVAAEEGGICHNLAGSYNCSCTKGYVGDGFRNGTGCMSTNVNRLVFPVIIRSVSSFLVVCLAASLLVWWLKKRHLKLVEAKYYQQLQQHIASAVGRESLRIFSAKELARASNNYSKEMVLGSGGFGTVFKGNTSDGIFVAI
ncbi:wall-associated receptor kinase 2 [Cryptomeria japonica]|uniref:wall-associated receptor kinase 2 n=1 Tax=Cryptomeria japonica TaxID=3369 RepID=UPI0025ABDBB9|nr:wall-associated receptor kinase 2 [Cryptomeria japonica]